MTGANPYSSQTEKAVAGSSLSMVNISKRFPGVLANDRVHFDVKPGEVHALLGENGAGKTTLMNILYGLYQPDEGAIFLNDKRVTLRSPKDAMNQGIGLVAQHFHLARRHTVAENIALGLSSTPFFYPTRKLHATIRELGDKYRLSVDPRAQVWQLSPGEQQRVEIIKALIQGAKILILDEPTSVLTPQEADALFDVLRRMKSEGEAVVFISHKLDEVMDIAERVTVLRKGALAGSVRVADTSAGELAKLMVGRSIFSDHKARDAAAGERVLELSDIWAKNHRNVDALKGLSLSLHQHEILGVAGVAGNGQAELCEILTGLRKPTQGRVDLAGTEVTDLGARALFEAGVAHIPEDRNHTGIVPSMSVAENLVLRQYRYPPFAKGALFNWEAVERFADKSIKEYEVATPSRDTPARLLSGGNVQKLILARELSGEPKLVVAAHPTYGLDVSAAALTHELLLEQRARGAGVLLVSEDLDELRKLSDRIVVLFAGKSMGVVEANEVSLEDLGLMMAGKVTEARKSENRVDV